jgi:hypothetical protein
MELMAWSLVLLELHIDAARGIDPKVLQTITSSLFSAEPDLVIARFSHASTIHHIFEVDLFGLCSPCHYGHTPKFSL